MSILPWKLIKNKTKKKMKDWIKRLCGFALVLQYIYFLGYFPRTSNIFEKYGMALTMMVSLGGKETSTPSMLITRVINCSQLNIAYKRKTITQDISNDKT